MSSAHKCSVLNLLSPIWVRTSSPGHGTWQKKQTEQGKMLWTMGGTAFLSRKFFIFVSSLCIKCFVAWYLFKLKFVLILINEAVLADAHWELDIPCFHYKVASYSCVGKNSCRNYFLFFFNFFFSLSLFCTHSSRNVSSKFCLAVPWYYVITALELFGIITTVVNENLIKK